jgi:hypothetical protein
MKRCAESKIVEEMRGQMHSGAAAQWCSGAVVQRRSGARQASFVAREIPAHSERLTVGRIEHSRL